MHDDCSQYSAVYAGCSNIHSSLFHKSMMVMCVSVHSTRYAECSNIQSKSHISSNKKISPISYI